MNVISGSTIVPKRLEQLRPERRSANVETHIRVVNERDRPRLAAMDDRMLVTECVAGNTTAFDELVTRYREKVLRLVASVIGTGADTEDIAQEIFIKIYLSLPRFRGDASFSTYLYTTTVNRCRDELRRTKLRKFFSFDEWFNGESADHPHGENEQQLETDERRLAVRQAMKRLPSDTQMLLYLREIEELSYKELADIFKVEMGTIKSRLARSRDRLREELIPYMRDGEMK